MISATSRLDVSTPMMTATAMVTAISAPTTNWTSAGVCGPGSSAVARLTAHLRAAVPAGVAGVAAANAAGEEAGNR